MDGGFTEKDPGQPSSYDSTSYHLPFDHFQESFYDQTGLPEFHFKDGLSCLEIDEPWMNSVASEFSPSQLFQAAEFSELQQLEEFFQPEHSHRSLSVSSPEYSIQFPTATRDDAAIARSMLAVMSSSSNFTSPRPSAMNQTWQSHERVRGGEEVGTWKVESRKVLPGKETVNRSFSPLRQIEAMTGGESPLQEAGHTANHLNHMISERKRREKLNESFSALRTLLPPATKKDKASVLAGTIEQANSLRTQISELEEVNKTMEQMVLLPEEDEEDGNGGEGEKERIRMSSVTKLCSGKQIIKLQVTVPADCDMIDLVLHVLECLRERPELQIISIESSVYVKQKTSDKRTRLNICLKGMDDMNEGPFKDALARAIKEALA